MGEKLDTWSMVVIRMVIHQMCLVRELMQYCAVWSEDSEGVTWSNDTSKTPEEYP